VTSPTPPDPLAAHERFNVENARRVKHKSVHETVMLAIIDRLTASAEQVRREARDRALMECRDLCEQYDDCSPSFIAEKIMDRALITPQKEGD